MAITEEAGVRAVVQGAAQYVSDSARVNAATGQMVAGVQKAARDSKAAEQSLAQVGSRMRELRLAGNLPRRRPHRSCSSRPRARWPVNFETAMTRISTLSGIAADDIAELQEGLFAIPHERAGAGRASARPADPPPPPPARRAPRRSPSSRRRRRRRPSASARRTRLPAPSPPRSRRSPRRDSPPRTPPTSCSPRCAKVAPRCRRSREPSAAWWASRLR